MKQENQTEQQKPNMKLTTTLNLLHKNNACELGMTTLLKHLGADYPADKPINLLTILDSNGVQHCLWALRATRQPKAAMKVAVRAAITFAEQALPLWEKYDATDKQPQQAIAAAKAWLNHPCPETASAADAASAAFATAFAASAAYAAQKEILKGLLQ